MSCYHPMLGIFQGEYYPSGKRKYAIRCGLDVSLKAPQDVIIPCGHCVGCRLDYSRRWADRMMLEYAVSDGAIFLTLTYDDDHLVDFLGDPLTDSTGFGSLYKRHLQLFMKSFRKEMSKYNRYLRFFASGEYGSWKNTHRPHYHIILFGVGLDFFSDKTEVGVNELKQRLYTSPFIKRFWPHGYISFGDVSWNTCAYVARYVMKKVNSESDDLLDLFCLNPEFSLMSRRPGIGKPYLDKYPDCLDYSNVFLSDDSGSKKVSIPKYFFASLKLTDPDRYDKIIEDRKRFANDRFLLELSKQDLGAVDYLASKEKQKLAVTKSLVRSI